MASSVFYRFKSQKDYSKIVFDGSSQGLAVFDLKRDIINLEKLGNGQDFDLHVANADTKQTYDDDAEVVPRGTSVIVSRRPPARGPGRGSAARYVTGNPVQISARRERDGPTGGAPSAAPSALGLPPPPPPVAGSSEDAAIRAMLAATSADWAMTQDKMAAARPVFRTGQTRPTGPVPDRPPPLGYICYRCGEKGHWIQACPTNGDENFDNRKRVKRTTGIPRSQLQKIDADTAGVSVDGTVAVGPDGKPVEDAGNGVMVTAEGESVVFVPDAASWETYQRSAEQSALARREQEKAALPEGFEDIACSICGKVAKDAVKVPCCDKMACDECLQAALLESDFVCPFCKTKDILLDRLVPATEIREKVEKYDNEYRGTKRGRDEEDEEEERKDDEEEEEQSPEDIMAAAAKEAGTTPEQMMQQMMLFQQMAAMAQASGNSEIPPPPSMPGDMPMMMPPAAMLGMMPPMMMMPPIMPGFPPPMPFIPPPSANGNFPTGSASPPVVSNGNGTGEDDRDGKPAGRPRQPDPRFAHNIGRNKLISRRDR
ncbi:Protein mpe1 [Savitreella phatthalungensis]